MTAPAYKKERRAAPAPVPVVSERKPRPPVTEAERDRIQKTIPLVKEHFPELVNMIRDWTNEGLIDGWRSVHVRMDKK